MLVNAIIKQDKDEYFAYIPQIKDYITKGNSYEEVLENIASENFIESLELQTLKNIIISLPLELDYNNDVIEAIVLVYNNLYNLAETKKQETYILKNNIPQDKYYEPEGIASRNAYNNTANQWCDIYEEVIRLGNELHELGYDFRN